MSAPAKGAPPSAPSPFDPHQGERIGRYHVISQLSVGGMAELFLGFTAGPGGFRKYVALKRILPDAASDESFEQMFLDEARITAAFSHPHIGQVFELGRDGGGLFLAMEFIAGQDLSRIASVALKRGRTLPLGFSLSVVRDVCLALHYAHTFTTPSGKSMPVIHRDVAQKNIMVTYDGLVKLLDFGIAKARGAASRTQVGMVKGTTGYMSPEQVRGDPLDGRSDLFAAGVMLHEMLTGQRLFSAESEIQEMRMILEAPIPSPSSRSAQVPQAVSAVVLKALSRDREQRYANGREMARAIEAAAGPLLQDAEQRATFLTEHFQQQMETTRRLLESADTVEVSEEPREEPREALGATDSPTEVRSTTVQDQETRVAPRPEARRPPPAAAPASRRSRDAETGEAPAVVTTGRRVPSRPSSTTKAVRSSSVDAPAQQPAAGQSRPWALIAVLLLVGAGAGFGVMKWLGASHPDPVVPTEPPPPPVGADLSAPRPLEPTSPSVPTPKLEAPPNAASLAAQQEDKTPGEDKDGEPARPAKQGLLTIVVLPEAEVFLNGRSLGKTPLFKVPVPAGQHRLRIQGPDGKRRELQAPVKAGKLVQFKLALTDIPER